MKGKSKIVDGERAESWRLTEKLTKRERDLESARNEGYRLGKDEAASESKRISEQQKIERFRALTGLMGAVGQTIAEVARAMASEKDQL